MGVAWVVLYIPFGSIGTIVLDQVIVILLTLALTVAVVNAMNFVDGLDGLAARAGLITAMAICVFRSAAPRPRRRRVLHPPASSRWSLRGVSGIPAAQLLPAKDLRPATRGRC